MLSFHLQDLRFSAAYSESQQGQSYLLTDYFYLRRNSYDVMCYIKKF